MNADSEGLTFICAELVPPRSLQAKLSALTCLLNRLPSLILTAGTRDYPFHLTLFFTVIEAESLREVREAVLMMPRSNHPFELTLRKWKAFPDGSLAIMVEATPRLLRFHRLIASRLSALQRPLKHIRFLKGYFTRSELERFLLAGDPYAFERFSPHITLARFANQSAARSAALSLPDFESTSLVRRVRVRAWTKEDVPSRTLASVHLRNK